MKDSIRLRTDNTALMDSISISTDKSKIDLQFTHQFLTNSYWSKGISIEDVKKGIDNSLCFGVYKDERQIGFARVITDTISFAYFSDVFIIESERGNGYSKALIDTICFHSNLNDVKNWYLITKDAQGLYEKFGFKKLDNPEREVMHSSKQNLINLNLQI